MVKLNKAVAAVKPKPTREDKLLFQKDIAKVAGVVEAFMAKYKKRYSGDKSFEDFTDDLLVAMLKD